MRGIILGLCVVFCFGAIIWLNLVDPTPAPPRTIQISQAQAEPEPDLVLSRALARAPAAIITAMPKRPTRNFSSLRSARTEATEEPVIAKEELVGEEEEIAPIEEPQHEKWVVSEDFGLEDLLEVLEYIEDNDLEEMIFEGKIGQINELIELRVGGAQEQSGDAQEGGDSLQAQLPGVNEISERERILVQELITHPVLQKYFAYEEKR